MGKKNAKVYFVVLAEADYPLPEIRLLDAEQIRELARKVDDDSYAVFEGTLIKGFVGEFDVRRIE